MATLLSTAHSVAEHSKHIIFVDEIAGVENTSCWYGGVDMPCKTLSLAKRGRELLPDVLIASIDETSSSGLSVALPVNTSLPACPVWMYRDEESRKCKCSDIPYRSVSCDSTIPRTSLLDCYCMTYNDVRNHSEMGRCIFSCSDIRKHDSVYNRLPNNTADLNEFMCGQEKRTSTLCGKCKDGYSPLVYSYELHCMNCTGMNYNWIKYVAVAYVPLTAFFIFVVLFKFSGTSPAMRAFITACQGLASPISIRVSLRVARHAKHYGPVIRFLATVYGIWNLDFFRTIIPPICLDITPLQALLLDYAIAFYPLFLVIISYILISLHSRDVRVVVWIWKPFQRIFSSINKNWEIQGSIVNALATFLLLSFLKVLDVSFDLLVYSEAYTQNGSTYTTRYVLYYDASVDMFSAEHLPYAVLAIVVMVVVIILPLLFLIFYPMKWFQKFLNVLPVRRECIVIFIDCFQGYYKDGTNGTRDYRYFSVILYVLQILIFSIFAFAKSTYCYSISLLALIPISFLILFCQPYKEQFKIYTYIDATMLLNVACAFIMIGAANVASIKEVYFQTFSYFAIGLFAFVPLLYVILLCLWWIVVKKRVGRAVVTRVRSCLCHSKKTKPISVDFESEPDRLQNPNGYAVLADPLFSIQNEGRVDYGSCNIHGV